MKTKLFLPVAMAFVVAGCGDSSNKSGTPTGGNVATAPADYLKSAADARHSAVKTVDVTSVKKAIDMFNVQEGRFPKDLKELVDKKYLPEVPTPPVGSKLEYDATAGTVKIVTQ